MKSIKAQAHVEMIISFSIFIGVLIILFFFMNPFLKPQEKNNNLDSVFRIFSDEISLNVGRVSIIVEGNNECYERPSQVGEKFIEIQDDVNPRKYTLYSSDYFPTGIISCSSQPQKNYSVGVYSEESLIIYEKILDLKARYDSNYQSLKQELGIMNDFSWSFKDLNGNIVAELSVSKSIPSTNVHSREISTIILDKFGESYEYILNLKVW
ncbi:MAG: hypothetical protein PHF67_02750 [Candidatus Nanoarchaeia archaeon]|nr:hypothetical protein [Candidatus Nanoarchaeia archaeon]